jgi:hypothetical protein
MSALEEIRDSKRKWLISSVVFLIPRSITFLASLASATITIIIGILELARNAGRKIVNLSKHLQIMSTITGSLSIVDAILSIPANFCIAETFSCEKEERKIMQKNGTKFQDGLDQEKNCDNISKYK